MCTAQTSPYTCRYTEQSVCVLKTVESKFDGFPSNRSRGRDHHHDAQGVVQTLLKTRRQHGIASTTTNVCVMVLAHANIVYVSVEARLLTTCARCELSGLSGTIALKRGRFTSITYGPPTTLQGCRMRSAAGAQRKRCSGLAAGLPRALCKAYLRLPRAEQKLTGTHHERSKVVSEPATRSHRYESRWFLCTAMSMSRLASRGQPARAY